MAELLKLAIVVAEEDHGDAREAATDLAREVGGVHLLRVHGDDDHVEPPVGGEEAEGLPGARGRVEARGVAEVQPVVLLEDEVGDLALLLQDERVVAARHQQHLADAVGHQLLEALEARREGGGPAPRGCRRRRGGHEA